MSKPKVRSHMLQLVDSDSEDDFGGNTLKVARSATAPTASQQSKSTKKSNVSTMPPKKRAAAGRQAANRVTKPAVKPSSTRRRSNDRIAAAADELIAGDRTASVEKPSNTKPAGKGGRKRAAAVEKEEEDIAMEDAPATAAPVSPVAKQKAARGRPKKIAVAIATPEPAPSGPRRGRKPGSKKTKPEAVEEEVSEIPETQQPDAMQNGLDEDDDHDDLADPPAPPSSERAETGRSNAPVPRSVSKRRASMPSSEPGDPALRRRLGEITQKYESLELRYRDLKEIAVKEAERNFDRLRKQSEEKSKLADQLIAALKAELAAQREASKDSQRLQKQLEAAESKAATLQTKVNELTASLADSKSEIKSLNLKLIAARSAEATAAAAAAVTKVPGSAMKGSAATAARLAAASTSEAVQQVTLAAQKKEDLYGDLTGLIVRSVKREGGEDVFDCIQTGRNGTLHFKLAIDADTSGSSGEAQCHYTPQLDVNRDRALIAVLPGFLVDEISFPQSQAGKFYARVIKALTDQVQQGE